MQEEYLKKKEKITGIQSDNHVDEKEITNYEELVELRVTYHNKLITFSQDKSRN